jgi:hypothetical protein
MFVMVDEPSQALVLVLSGKLIVVVLLAINLVPITKPIIMVLILIPNIYDLPMRIAEVRNPFVGESNNKAQSVARNCHIHFLLKDMTVQANQELY